MYHAPDPQKVLIPPLHCFVNYLKTGQRVRIHLHCNNEFYMEGLFKGFDEFMSVVLDEAVEVYIKQHNRVPLGTVLLRGENLSIVHPIP